MSFQKNRSSKFQFVGHKTFYVCDPSGEKKNWKNKVNDTQINLNDTRNYLLALLA